MADVDITSVLLYSAIIAVILLLAFHLHDYIASEEGFAISQLKNATQEYKNREREQSGQGNANMLTSDSNRPPYAGKENLSLSSANNLLTGQGQYNKVAKDVLDTMYSGPDNDGIADQGHKFDVEAMSMAENQLHDKVQQDTYNDYLVDSQLDQSTLVSHQQFVYDQNKLRNKGGTASHHTIFTPADVPFVGLRRPNYRDADTHLYRGGTEHSVRSSQLPQSERKIIL